MDVDARARAAARQSRSSTSSRTRTSPARGTRSAGRTSRSCSTAGINVISTLNIQHLESLNDVVEQITGVKQRETIPDDVVRARRPDRARRHARPRRSAGAWPTATSIPPSGSTPRSATTSGPGNLGALRELALLWVADRVDEALAEYRERHGIDRAVGDARARPRRAHRARRRRAAHPPCRAHGAAHEGRTPRACTCTRRTVSRAPSADAARAATRARRGARRDVPRGRGRRRRRRRSRRSPGA